MSEGSWRQIAIVDYGMGNLFSVKHACESVGLNASITASRQEILTADAVILPGVGAFGDAMATLDRLQLVDVLRQVAASGKPLVGICLGMQLLMTRSYEFGCHQGLGIVEGEVVRFQGSAEGSARLKVPQVGWNHIYGTGNASWQTSFLDGLEDREFMYFVHSFYAKPADTTLILSKTRYGFIEFCSSLNQGNVFACQFHPERSGPQGLRIYQNLAERITGRIGEVRRV